LTALTSPYLTPTPDPPIRGTKPIRGAPTSLPARARFGGFALRQRCWRDIVVGLGKQGQRFSCNWGGWMAGLFSARSEVGGVVTMLPPRPSAVVEYFRRRRCSLNQLTAEDLTYNDWLWRQACGLSGGREADIAAQDALCRRWRGPGARKSGGDSSGGRSPKSYICEDCGGRFVAKRRARFCSTRCQVAAYRAGKRGGVLEVRD
jgi:hypothetical protein